MSEHILIVDDEKEIADLVGLYLGNEGYTVSVYNTGKEALQSAETQHYDLAILDVMLPDLDGFSICRKLREKYFYPIIMLTAKGEDTDRIVGLEMGADDYLPKPFHLAELNARIKSVIRRNQHDGEIDIRQGNVRIEPDKYRVFVNNQELELNRKEYDILLYFINRPGHLVNKNTLAESVWGDHIDQVDNFDFIYAQIKNLRKKLKDAGADLEIKAVYGFGYKMIVEEQKQ